MSKKDEILIIASDLREGFITTDEATDYLLRLLGAINSVCDCEIPKPKDPYHDIDKKVCRDCNGNIKVEIN